MSSAIGSDECLVTGFVSDAITGQAIPGTRVTISGNVYSGFTDSTGTYSFISTEKNESELVVAAKGYHISRVTLPLCTRDTTLVDFMLMPLNLEHGVVDTCEYAREWRRRYDSLSRENAHVAYTQRTSPRVSIAGQITDYLTGTPLCSVEVRAYGNSHWYASTTTDRHGHFYFTELESGTYTLSYLPLGYDAQQSKSISINSETTAVVHAELPKDRYVVETDGEAMPPGDIICIVVDVRTGEPLHGASVLVVGMNRGSVTDGGGECRIPDVPVYTHSLKATAVGYYTVECCQVQVRPDATIVLNVHLAEKPIDLNGVITTRHLIE